MALPEAHQRAILEWVNTFSPPGAPHQSLSQLTDGVVLMHILHQIAPSFFDVSTISSDASDNWVIASNNLKKLLRNLEAYYLQVLHKRVNAPSLDLNSVAKNESAVELKRLMELILGCAILGSKRSDYVRTILTMDHESQEIFKEMIESVMHSVEDAVDDFAADEQKLADNAQEEELLHAQQVIDKLSQDKDKLKDKLMSVEAALERATDQKATLENQFLGLKLEHEQIEASLRKQIDVSASRVVELETSLLKTQQEAETKTATIQELQTQNQSYVRQIEENKVRSLALNTQIHELRDQLDIAEVTSKKLADAERKIDRYERKLDEVKTLQEHLKSVEDKSQEYFEKILELEPLVQENARLDLMNEELRKLNSDLRSQLSGSSESIDTHARELQDLVTQLHDWKNKYKESQDMLSKVQAELQEVEQSPGTGLGVYESTIKLREDVTRLERELRRAKEHARNQDTQTESQDLSKERTGRAHAERALMEANLRIAELEASISGNSSGSLSVSSGQSSDPQVSERIRALEKENAGLVENKKKLETFLRETFSRIHEQFQETHQKQKQKVSQLKAKVAYLEDKLARDSECHRRERILLASALHEHGLEMMYRTRHAQWTTNASAGGWLPAQRADAELGQGH